eukprot:TRINITY_DN10648_c0_g1_i1.p1 TRINITY_DN10648_c0_g1~~TRINITY_DN10648_c0_g1_i1.p1  ORF type:complete len:438 (+),score=81.00 TRINITY_DN10648_c0_g1_i1:161-1474(+)
MSKNNGGSEEDIVGKVLHVRPFQYVHILNTNLNVAHLESGPKRVICLAHEKVVLGPEKMIVIPPMSFCIIENPVVRDEKGNVVFEKSGQVKLRHGDREIRGREVGFIVDEPFPLYPGEVLVDKVSYCQVVPRDKALRLRALRDFYDYEIETQPQIQGASDKKQKKPEIGSSSKNLVKKKYNAGDEILFIGPDVYKPRVELEVVEVVKGVTLAPYQALHLHALRDCIDSTGKERKMGEEWLERGEGWHLPHVHEKVIGVVNAILLNDKTALHLRATKTFVDVYGVQRKNGEEWCIDNTVTDNHIPDVCEKVIETVPVTVLTSLQHCVIKDPFDEETKKPKLGTKKIVKGHAVFFRKPGESVEVRDNFIVNQGSARYFRCIESFLDSSIEGATPKRRNAGDRFLVFGPTSYIPPVQVENLYEKKALIRFETLGIYAFYF